MAEMKSCCYDIVMIVPFMKRQIVNNLLHSLLENNKRHLILLILVDMSLEQEEMLQTSNLLTVERIFLNKKLSSSQSRNKGIEFLLSHNVSFRYLMFPDDDTTFDASFFDLYDRVIQGNTILNVLCQETKKPYSNYHIKDGALLRKRDVLFVGCVRLLLSRETFYKVGFFDEQLGIGAKYGAGEDGDYFLRALAYGEFHYTEKLYTLHPTPSGKYRSMSFKSLITRFNNYGKGVMYMLCKHKLYREGCIVCLRAIAGGGVAFITGKWRLACAYWCSFFSRFFMFLSRLIIVK